MGSKTTIYLSLGLHKERPSYKRSLQLSKEAIRHFTKHEIFQFFSTFCVIFALLDPDPQSKYISRSGTAKSIADPDPQRCNQQVFISKYGIDTVVSNTYDDDLGNDDIYTRRSL